MADGKDCKCAAWDESECACDADWTPQELIDARAEIARLRLTDAELKAVRTAAFAFAQNDDDPECAETAARLLAIAERMK